MSMHSQKAHKCSRWTAYLCSKPQKCENRGFNLWPGAKRDSLFLLWDYLNRSSPKFERQPLFSGLIGDARCRPNSPGIRHVTIPVRMVLRTDEQAEKGGLTISEKVVDTQEKLCKHQQSESKHGLPPLGCLGFHFTIFMGAIHL